MSKYKVIFHIDEDDPFRVNLVLNNINNLIEDLGSEDVELELVAYARGIKIFLIDSPYAKNMENLADAGVIFAGCSNTIKAMEIKQDELLNSVQIVSSGVGELVKKQSKGWVYIRP